MKDWVMAAAVVLTIATSVTILGDRIQAQRILEAKTLAAEQRVLVDERNAMIKRLKAMDEREKSTPLPTCETTKSFQGADCFLDV